MTWYPFWFLRNPIDRDAESSNSITTQYFPAWRPNNEYRIVYSLRKRLTKGKEEKKKTQKSTKGKNKREERSEKVKQRQKTKEQRERRTKKRTEMKNHKNPKKQIDTHFDDQSKLNE